MSFNDVFITGISGQFPKCENVTELFKNLCEQKELSSNIPHIWKIMAPCYPAKVGKLNDLNKFDAGFFGIHYQQAQNMDPGCKKLLENTISAIIDAGINPSSLKGSNTGVFMATPSYQESEMSAVYDNLFNSSLGMTGCTRSMYAQWISYCLGLDGPCITIDTACSASGTAVEHAFRAISLGQCENAIVGGANLLLNYNTTAGFCFSGIVDKRGEAHVFDESANGILRSETVAVLFFQKRHNAKRIYAKITNARLNSDGFTKEGILCPSQEMQEELFYETYNEVEIKPELLTYFEAHATGTRVGVANEVRAIEKVFCANKQSALNIGCVKSIVGHSETVSGITSIIKVIFQMKNDFLIPNANFKNPDKNIEAFRNGKIRVVTEITKDTSKYCGVHNSGIGGSNAHVILERYNCQHNSVEQKSVRLLCVSGRTKKFCSNVFRSIRDNSKNENYLALLQGVFHKEIEEFVFKGYILLQNGRILKESITYNHNKKMELCLVLNGPSYNWIKLLQHFFDMELFHEVLQSITVAVSIVDPQLLSKITQNQTLEKQELFLGSVISQIATIEALRFLEIYIDHIVGSSSGIISCAFANKAFTIIEAIKIAYQLAFKKENIIKPSPLQEKISTAVINKHTVIYKCGKAKTGDKFDVETHFCIDDHLTCAPEQMVLLCIKLQELSKSHQCLINYKHFLSCIGQLYQLGFKPNLEKLYSNHPVPVNLPFISPLLDWSHNENWHSFEYSPKFCLGIKSFCISLNNEEGAWKFLQGHNINGQILFPAAGYIYIVWKTYLQYFGLILEDSKLVFENVKFLHKIIVSAEDMHLTVQISKISQKFEVYDGRNIVVTGKIRPLAKNEVLTDVSIISKPTTFLQSKDVYKKLKLNGYYFQDNFRGIKEMSYDNTYSSLLWAGNWITFLDSSLQAILIKEVDRLLVPTEIEHLMIDSPLHLQNNPSVIAALQPYDCNIIRSPGMEIKCVHTVPISVRENNAEAILETYRFVPLNDKLPIQEAIQVIMQLVLENSTKRSVHITEIVENLTESVLSPFIIKWFDNEPKAQMNLKLFTKIPISVPKVVTESKQIDELDTDNNMVIISHALQKPKIIQEIVRKSVDNIFILTKERSGNVEDWSKTITDIDVLAVYETDDEKLVLLRKSSNYTEPKVIYVHSTVTSWLHELQTSIVNRQKVLLVSENKLDSGVLGLINCLRIEIDFTLLSCVLIKSSRMKFNIDDDFYKIQMRKGLFINVLKNGKWGTYRHLPLFPKSLSKLEHYMGVFVRGNISTIHWIEGPLKTKISLPEEKRLVEVYNVGLNFKDVFEASGMVSVNNKNSELFCDDYFVGLEFSGKDLCGKRVMGFTQGGALSNLVASSIYTTWNIPNEWSFQDAATVPTTYSTVLYALIKVGRIKKSQSILIHAGAGGVGLSAINVALYYQCNIFITVGTLKKRNFVKKLYPSLSDAQIGNSRDGSFYELIMKETRGKGVDLVLNSLSKDKLYAGLKCLAKKGKFLEIGKYDEHKNNPLKFDLLENRSFCGIFLDNQAFFNGKQNITQLVSDGIQMGYVKPLPKSVYDKREVVDAISRMSSGKHIGKLVIDIKNDNIKTEPSIPDVKPMFHCFGDSVYILVGGLGRFGLELTEWLIKRGARKLIIVSRRFTTTAYQDYKLRKWQINGVTVQVIVKDLSSKTNCVELLEEATNLGRIDGIFVLSAVINDMLFENHTQATFTLSFLAKRTITANLDETSRTLCPNLRHFVTFSSQASGRGNFGQTSYGMANSMIESICENRHKLGFPALAIQWGPIKDVGTLSEANPNTAIMGMLQQNISSCFKALDSFLTQSNPIVSSMVIVPKTVETVDNDILSVVTSLLGINKDQVSLSSTLAELGMSSVSSVEVLNLLEKQFHIYMSLNELRTTTLNNLKQMDEKIANSGH